MKLKVSRVLTFDYEVDMSSYPGMSPEEAVKYEQELYLSDIAELFEYNNVNCFVNVSTTKEN